MSHDLLGKCRIMTHILSLQVCILRELLDFQASCIGDSRTGVLGRGAAASSAAFDRERYAVHAIPIVETKGCIYALAEEI